MSLGVVLENIAETYTVESNVSITCRSDTDTERIEWLTQEGTVIVSESNVTQLDLHFTPVNDSIHGQVYICRVIRSDSDIIAEQNFTMNVVGWYSDRAIIINIMTRMCMILYFSSNCRDCTGIEHCSIEKQ
jgi:phenolic acid decarboxylase